MRKHKSRKSGSKAHRATPSKPAHNGGDVTQGRGKVEHFAYTNASRQTGKVGSVSMDANPLRNGGTVDRISRR